MCMAILVLLKDLDLYSGVMKFTIYVDGLKDIITMLLVYIPLLWK